MEGSASLSPTAQACHIHSPTPRDNHQNFYPDSINSISHFEDSESCKQQKAITTERDAVGILCYTIPAFVFTYIVFGYAVNIVQMSKYSLVMQQGWGVNKHWFAVFFSGSALINAGMNLLDANMIVFSTDWPMLGFMCLQVVAGKI